MKMESYNFNERLAMSHGVSGDKSIKDILMQHIPGARFIYSAHEDNDRNGTDYWIEHAGGKHLSIDVKVREEDYAQKGHDDLAL